MELFPSIKLRRTESTLEVETDKTCIEFKIVQRTEALKIKGKFMCSVSIDPLYNEDS